MCHYDRRSCIRFEVQLPKSSLDELQISAAAFLLRSQQDDPSMATGRIGAQISETFVTGDQPACLILNTSPNNFIRKASPSLCNNRFCVMTAGGKEFGYLSR